MIPEISAEFDKLKQKKKDVGYNFLTPEEKLRYQQLRLEEKRGNRLKSREKKFKILATEYEKHQRIREKSKMLQIIFIIVVVVLVVRFLMNAAKDTDVNYAQEYQYCLDFAKNNQERQYCKDQFAAPAYYQCLKSATTEEIKERCENFLR